ncbi:MAG TPA: hypothetical protein VJV77_08435 [Casimicrobiaceae bacterium]|nr:hypothetical protein [Casimicrobiaceae bacterium]
MAPLDSPLPHASVDAENPWLGLASFTEETQAWFYGREEEVAELARRVQRKTLTLLFGQSGLGKTSILGAGIVPKLRALGFCPVYLRVDYAPGAPSPSEQLKGAIFRATEQSGQWTQAGVAVAGESLWEFLHHRGDVLRDASGRTLTPLLIFDQFEEIFTLAQGDAFGRARAAEFIDDLADLVENRPPRKLEAAIEREEAAAERFDFTRSDYRVLLALREDYLAHLEAFKAVMPSITQNRMRLARMTGDQALAAVLKPGGKLVSHEVAEAIVRFIAGGSELRNAEVEPSLLSLICRELNNARVAQGRSEISADLLAGSHDTILAEFYERALADQPHAVRHFIEDELLTESGFRESIAEERVRNAFAAAGAAPEALAALVNRRLLRIEERLDLRRVELTHDVLCSVVRASRNLRREREARDAAERKLAEQRERERATRKALIRARQVAAICGMLAIGAVASAIFGYVSMHRAQRAEALAQQTRMLAESARGESEKLIVYLLDDFYLELEPVGRLDIVAQLSKRALDYYEALPAQLRTDETDRNRALALVRYGAVLRTQNKLDESGKALADAVAVLGRLRAGGDQSEPTAVGLGMGLMSQARVRDSLNDFPDARRLGAEAVAVLKPMMAGPRPSVGLRRAYGATLNYLGYSQLTSDREEAAVKTLEEARAAYRSIDDLKLTDLPAASAYAEATAWELAALQSLGLVEQTRRVGEEALEVANQVVAQRPNHMGALRSRALINEALADAEADDLRLAKAVTHREDGARDWEAIVRIDPSNQIAWNNLSNSKTQESFALFRMGRIGDARATWRAALALERNVKLSAFLARTFSFPAGALAFLEADVGNPKAAEAALAENARLSDIAAKGLAQDAVGRFLLREFAQQLFGYAVPTAAGDYQTVRATAEAALARIKVRRTEDSSQELNRTKLLAGTAYVLADACYRARDYPAAQRAIGEATDSRQLIPHRTTQDARDANDEQILAAMIAARLGQREEAQRIISPALAYHRMLYARGNDDLTQHLQLARALYAFALANPKHSSPELAEAAAIIDRLPHPMQSLISTRRLRAWIAEAQAS